VLFRSNPKRLWSDAHQLYVFAEGLGITDTLVVDKESGGKKFSIENNYKQLLLFSLARPIALRQRDSERVFQELFEWATFSSIQREASNDMVDNIFSMRIYEDSAPRYLSKSDLAEDIIIRTLNADKLVNHVHALIEQKKQQKQKRATGDQIPGKQLAALAASWGVSAKRRFSRADRQGHINVAIGLSRSAKAICDSFKVGGTIDTKSGFVRTAASTKQDPDFTLESISHANEDSPYLTHTEVGATDNESWDMVAKGRLLADTYANQKKK